MGKEIYFTTQNIHSQAKKYIQELKKIHSFPEIDFIPDAAALLVIDMQKYFLNKNSHAFLPSAPAIIPTIKKLIKSFRKKKDQ